MVDDFSGLEEDDDDDDADDDDDDDTNVYDDDDGTNVYDDDDDDTYVYDDDDHNSTCRFMYDEVECGRRDGSCYLAWSWKHVTAHFRYL